MLVPHACSISNVRHCIALLLFFHIFKKLNIGIIKKIDIFVLGHYMYIETSAPRRPNDKARLSSTTYTKSTNDECLQFYYHMYGANIGTLNVKVSCSY